MKLSEGITLEYHIYDHKVLRKLKDYIVIVFNKKINDDLYIIYMKSINNCPINDKFERGKTIVKYLL